MRFLTVALVFLIPFSLYASARSDSGGLADRVAELEAQVEVLTAALQDAQEILQYVRVETGEIRSVTGPHWIIEGVNVHVRSGSGETSDDCTPTEPDFPNCEVLTGLGNLIVGYNRGLPSRSGIDRRKGSHNLIVGDFHWYSSFGGFVAGSINRVTGPRASVCGGTGNRATGFASSVCGGHANLATGDFSSVSGGQLNVASGESSSVSGGEGREAPGEFDWAAGNLFEEN
jgi:hypothetical protein